MSRAGAKRPKALAADGTEVKPGDIRVVQAPAPVMPPDAKRAFRAHQVFLRCQHKIRYGRV